MGTPADDEVQDVLAMSDEDFLNLSGPAAGETPQPTGAEEVTEPASDDAPADTALPVENTEPPETEEEEPGKPESEEDDPENLAQLDEGKEEGDKSKPEAGSEPGKEKAASTEGKETEAKPVDYKQFHDEIMKPFKANGKMIELRTPEEAIQLMKMGANYTRKMQDLQPHRKVLLMLENNGLLDEGKLSYLIDLDKKDPTAIAKLVKEAKIDPMDIDVNADTAYREGNHLVSDEEASFRNALDEISSSDSGKATLHVINSTWDQASKELLWKQPGVMSLINVQRETGIYDRIVTEIERRKTLGQLPQQQSFLQSYKEVGDALVASGAFADIVQQEQAPTAKPAPVATRTVAPKPQVKNGEKVSAAAPTRSSPRPVKPLINPLAMSDDDFLKDFQGRL
jgi:hypothetical protein